MQGVSAISQYVEALPTSSGPAATGRRGGRPRPLPPLVAARVREQGGDDAEALIEVATSPTYGAPSRTSSKEPIRPGDTDERVRERPSPLDAVVSPIADADEPRLLVLLALLGSMTLTALTLAARRQRL